MIVPCSGGTDLTTVACAPRSSGPQSRGFLPVTPRRAGSLQKKSPLGIDRRAKMYSSSGNARRLVVIRFCHVCGGSAGVAGGHDGFSKNSLQSPFLTIYDF